PHVLRNVVSPGAVTVVGIAATYVLTPFVIHTLGAEGYGVWTLIASLTGFISLLAMGVPMACVRYVAQHVAERDAARANEAIGSCAGLYLMLGAAAIVVGGILRRVFLRVRGLLLPPVRTGALLALDASLVLLSLVQLACFAFDFGIGWICIRRRY